MENRATARTITVFRLYLAEAVIPVAVSTVSASAAIGGVPPRAIATMLTAGVRATATMGTTKASPKTNCIAFVACRISTLVSATLIERSQ